MKAKKGKKAKAVSKKISKFQKVRKMFGEKNSWTVDEIVKRSGFDERNARTCISILKNPERTKNLLMTEYDRETRTYTLKKGS